MLFSMKKRDQKKNVTKLLRMCEIYFCRTKLMIRNKLQKCLKMALCLLLKSIFRLLLFFEPFL